MYVLYQEDARLGSESTQMLSQQRTLIYSFGGEDMSTLPSPQEHPKSWALSFCRCKPFLLLLCLHAMVTSSPILHLSRQSQKRGAAQEVEVGHADWGAMIL